TRVVVAIARPREGTITRLSIRDPIPYAATTSLPKLVTITTIMVIPAARVDCSRLAGRPRWKSRFVHSRSNFMSDQLILIPLFPRHKIYNPKMAEKPWVSTLATAAPATPYPGMGPKPYINRGSRIRLRKTVTNMTYIGSITFPIPRISDWKTKNIKRNINPKEDTLK